MAQDKEYSTNNEVKRSEDFQDKVSLKEKVLTIIKGLLESTSDDAFTKVGYKKNETNAGVYGDKATYGAGAKEDQYSVQIADTTKSFFTKQTFLGTKNVVSVINVVFKDGVVEIEYKSPESGFFRGVDDKGKTYMINEKLTLKTDNTNNFKNELEKQFKNFAQKEVGYLTSTKIGVDDRNEKSTSSVVENTMKTFNMKKLSIKEMFIGQEDMNSDKIKSLNTIDLKNTTPPIKGADDKKLFFDEDVVSETGEWADDEEGVAWKDSMRNALTALEDVTEGKLHLIDVRGFDKYQGPYGIVEIEGKKYKVWFLENDRLYIEGYPVTNTAPNENPGFKGTMQDVAELVNGTYNPNVSRTLQTIPGTDFSMNEVTTSGPTISGSDGGYKDGAQSGAGGYNTPKAWKKTPYGQNKTSKRPKITRDYKIVPQEQEEPKAEKNTNSKSVTSNSAPEQKSKGTDLNSGKGDYKNANQSNAPKSDSDGFWEEVKLIPGSGYVPVGMDQNFIAGMHNASKSDLKKHGYAESENKDDKSVIKENSESTEKSNLDKNTNSLKRKFFSLEENKALGINKRYLITEKTTKEYQKERWEKLSTFKTRESIKEAEELNNYFDMLEENKDPNNTIFTKAVLSENVNKEPEEQIINENTNNEETVMVEKPNSKFGTPYKFFKKDFLNEAKKYILDLNSRMFVPNPNAK